MKTKNYEVMLRWEHTMTVAAASMDEAIEKAKDHAVHNCSLNYDTLYLEYASGPADED